MDTFFNTIHSKTLLLVVFDEFENFNSVFLYFLDKPLRTVLIHLTKWKNTYLNYLITG
jgi:murein tripeptide amidase MpaA